MASSPKLEAELIDRLRRARLLLCTVESCTGGLLAHRLTEIAGASDVFWGGIVAYDNAAKETIVGVSAELLRNHGAVSPETARELARLAATKIAPREGWQAVGLSTTGIAGPSGGTPAKPVGLCHVGLALPRLSPVSREIRITPPLTRSENKERFANLALELLLEALSE
ncbi:MAG: nicotinamide-nucleotide amidohydrolase family protein [Oligoflexia bacterium]|nr:nicotinamide-nucleotide amidohydrolase family protein [Oligoflexia bacterium]